MTADSVQSRIGARQGLPEKAGDSRLHVVIVESIYLCILLAVAALYLTGTLPRPHLVVYFPLGVVWFGALGAVLISLTGAVEHREDWDASWNSWHYTRPLVGAALAVVSWLIFQAGILAVGSTPAAQQGTSGNAGNNAGAPTNVLFYLIAFVVGYREETFRELIKRVADVILTPKSPPEKAVQPTITSINPPTGKAAGGETIVITGTGFTDKTAVRFGSSAASAVHVDGDSQITVTTPQASPGPARVSVTTVGGSATADFTFT